MKIGAVNNFTNDICDEIELISSEGFDFVDLTLEPLFSSNIDSRQVSEALKRTGLGVIGHTSPFIPVIFPLESIREASMSEFFSYIDFFHEIGVDLMNVHPSLNGSLMSENDIFEKNRVFISRVNDVCRKKGITLMVESVTKPFNTPESFERLLKGMDDVKLHLDVGHCHLNTDRDLVEEFFSVFGERIVHLHFSDNFLNQDNHLPLGSGMIDWKDTVRKLKKYSYERTITLEVFSKDRRYLLHSKKYLEEILQEVY